MNTPGGSVFSIAAILSLTSATTCRELPPMIIITMPVTASRLPSRVTAPWRSIGAKATVPMSAILIGVPSARASSTMLRMSSSDPTSPSARISRCSAPRRIAPPPELPLFSSSAANTCPREMP